MIRVRVFPTLLIAAAIGTGMAHAAHISIDSVFCLDTITRDTTTGLDWLDLTVTKGLNSSQLVDLLAESSSSGWRYATPSELSQFWSVYSPLTDVDNAQALVDIIGGDLNPAGPLAAYGIFDVHDFCFTIGCVPLDPYDILGEICGVEGHNCFATIFSLSIFHNPDSVEIEGQEANFPTRHGTAHVLVRTGTAIPEPSTLWLLCGGLAMLLAVKATKGYARVSPVIHSQ